jgi:hypothetical protein
MKVWEVVAEMEQKGIRAILVDGELYTLDIALGEEFAHYLSGPRNLERNDELDVSFPLREADFQPLQIVQAVDSVGFFKKGERLLYLGEIKQMPGHVAVVKMDGRVLWGWHTENFENPENL